MPRSPDLVIFVLTIDDRQNQLLYPLLHMRAQGNYIMVVTNDGSLIILMDSSTCTKPIVPESVQ